MFEKLLNRFFQGKIISLSIMIKFRIRLFRIPLQQMLDINDIIWYCSEIRHQIEKKRYQSANSYHPLLKYVRSNSIPTRSNQPATTTTAATTTSGYSFSNALTTVSF